jgi:hypothetical protein
MVSEDPSDLKKGNIVAIPDAVSLESSAACSPDITEIA